MLHEDLGGGGFGSTLARQTLSQVCYGSKGLLAMVSTFLPLTHIMPESLQSCNDPPSSSSLSYSVSSA